MNEKQKSESFDEKWALGFVMPNLFTRDFFEFEFGYIAIVCGTDDRLHKIRDSSSAANALLSGFSDCLGPGRSPSAIIYRNPERFSNLRDAMVDARNCVAVACSCFGWVLSIGQQNNYFVCDTDHFDFYPRWPSLDGKSIKYHGPAFNLLTSNLPGFQGMTHPYLAVAFESQPAPDADLMCKLSKAWRRIHVTHDPAENDSRLFRALSVAYEACRVPQSMDNPLYDHGKHCSLWVSAFETLAHFGKKNGFEQVVKLIGKRQLFEPELSKKEMIQIGKTQCSLNAAQRLYHHLHLARNDFLHGNPLSDETFIPHELADGIRLLDVAPLVFHTILEACFPHPQSNGTIADDSAEMWRIIRQREFEKGYLRALGIDSLIAPPYTS